MLSRFPIPGVFAVPVAQRHQSAAGRECRVFAMMASGADIDTDPPAVDILDDICIGVVGEREIAQVFSAGVDDLVRVAAGGGTEAVASLDRKPIFAEPVFAGSRKDEEQLVGSMVPVKRRCRPSGGHNVERSTQPVESKGDAELGCPGGKPR